MKSFFNKILKLRKRKKTLKKFSYFLKNGQYLGDSRAKVFFLRANDINQDFCEQQLKRKFSSSFLKQQLYLSNLKSKDKFFEGEIIVFGNTTEDDNPASVKVFNLEKKEVVTIYQDTQKMYKDLNAYDFFLEKLPLVPILFKDIEQKVIKEKLIFGKKIELLDNKEYTKLFNNIINNYCSYFKNERKISFVCISELINEAKQKRFDIGIGKQIFKKLENIKSKQVPLITLHGDFTYSNLLLDNKSCYFIDFEHYGKYCFYYDIFWLMQNEYVYGHNKTLMKQYFNGELDSYFKILFKSIGESFDSSLRVEYYYVFLLEMYNKRVHNLKDKKVVFDYIKNILYDFGIED